MVYLRFIDLELNIQLVLLVIFSTETLYNFSLLEKVVFLVQYLIAIFFPPVHYRRRQLPI